MNRYPPLSAEELPLALRLIRSENIGPITFLKLREFYGSLAKAIDAVPALAARGRGKPIVLAAENTVRQEIERTQALGARLLVYGEADYPAMLLPLYDPPPVLIARGDLSLLSRECVGVVGTRDPSANGWNFARQLSGDLGKAGVCVVSGLARGIDAAAHQGALGTGTVAVVASGIDRVYPPENEKLHGEILEKGLILTEQPCGQEPFAHAFPARNRIISGLSKGVVVVEASVRSGTLITARFALEQGRDVFAVPGSPFDARCKGSNDLLRQGAIVTESADDVLAVLHDTRARPAALLEPVREDYAFEPFEEEPPPAEGARERLIASLSAAPTCTDDLIALSGVPPRVAMGVLLELELSGRLQRLAGGRVALVA